MAKQTNLLPAFLLIACASSVISGFVFSMPSIRAVRVINQEDYAVGSVRLVRWWQVSGELKRARQNESDPTLRIRVCKLRKGEIPEFVQLNGPEDKLSRRSRVEDRNICDTRV